MKVSVIIPSRLAANTASRVGNLFLDRCVSHILGQSARVDIEVIVGLDPGRLAAVPKRFRKSRSGSAVVRFEEARIAGQAAAVNAAARAALGDVIAFCEDDDVWLSRKLDHQLGLLEHFEFVSCNQREVDALGGFAGINDFPTPSGWVMRRESWERIGPLNEGFRFHVDTEWLGRANAAGLSRCHLVHDGHGGSEWLASVERHSRIDIARGSPAPLVDRLINDAGGIAQITNDERAADVSRAEHAQMRERFGDIPW